MRVKLKIKLLLAICTIANIVSTWAVFKLNGLGTGVWYYHIGKQVREVAAAEITATEDVDAGRSNAS